MAGNELRSLNIGVNFGVRDQQLRAANRQVDYFKQNVNMSSGALQRMGAQAAATGAKIKAAFAGAISTLQRYRFQLMIAFGAVAGAIGGTVRAAGEFEYQMTRVGQLAGATEAELESLKQEAKDLGVETAFTAKESAEGMEELARAGFEVNEIVSAMPGILELAAGTKVDLAGSAELVTDTLSVMNMEAEETGRVVDVLSKSAASTRAEVTEMGAAMREVGPMITAMGGDLEEAAGALSMLAEEGRRGSQAGRHLSTIIDRMTAPTDAAAEAMEQLGVSTSDLFEDGDFIGVTDAIRQFEVALEDVNDEQRSFYRRAIFGQRAGRVFEQVMAGGADEVEHFTAKLEDADGFAQELAEEQLDTLRGAMDRLRGSVNVAAINIGDFFVPVIERAMDSVTEIINVFNEAPQATQNLTGGLLMAGGLALGLATAVSFLAKPLGALKNAFVTVGGVLGITAGKFAIGAAAAVALWLAIEDLYYGMYHGYDSVLLPVIDGFLEFIGVQRDLKEIVEDVGSVITDIFGGAWEVVEGMGWQIIGMVKLIGGAFHWLATGETWLLESALEDLGHGAEMVAEGLSSVWQGIKGLFGEAWNFLRFIGGAILSLLDWIGRLPETVATRVDDVAEWLGLPTRVDIYEWWVDLTGIELNWLMRPEVDFDELEYDPPEWFSVDYWKDKLPTAVGKVIHFLPDVSLGEFDIPEWFSVDYWREKLPSVIEWSIDLLPSFDWLPGGNGNGEPTVSGADRRQARSTDEQARGRTGADIVQGDRDIIQEIRNEYDIDIPIEGGDTDEQTARAVERKLREFIEQIEAEELPEGDY